MANVLEHDIKRTGSWQADNVKWMENVNAIVNELQSLASYATTACVTPPNFEIDTNFDIQNGDEESSSQSPQSIRHVSIISTKF